MSINTSQRGLQKGWTMDPNNINEIGNRIIIMGGVCLVILGLMILSPILAFVMLAPLRRMEGHEFYWLNRRRR